MLHHAIRRRPLHRVNLHDEPQKRRKRRKVSLDPDQAGTNPTQVVDDQRGRRVLCLLRTISSGVNGAERPWSNIPV